MHKPYRKWKNVKGYDNYIVSDEGDIMNKNTGRILKPIHDSRGYCQLHLYQNGIRTTVMLHKIVADAFISNPENKPEVDHIDTDKDNNWVSNLQRVTRKENISNPLTLQHMRDNHPKGDTHPNYGKRGSNAVTHKAVLQYSLDGEFIREWPSIIEAGEGTGVNSSCISSCCKGKLKTSGGYIWRHK